MKNNNLLLFLFYILFPISLINWTTYLWVPLFLCILGNCIFNSDDISIKDLIKNKILKYFISFVVLFIIQLLFINLIFKFNSLNLSYNKLMNYSQYIMFYHYLIMFFMFYPLFKSISKDYKICKYLLILFFCFTSLTFVLKDIPFISYISYYLFKFNEGEWFEIYCLYLFILYYFNSINFKKIYRYIFYIIALIISIIVLYFSFRYQYIHDLMLNVNSPFIIYIIFVLCLLSKYELSFLNLIDVPIYFAYPLISTTIYICLNELTTIPFVLMILLITLVPYFICYILSRISFFSCINISSNFKKENYEK